MKKYSTLSIDRINQKWSSELINKWMNNLTNNNNINIVTDRSEYKNNLCMALYLPALEGPRKLRIFWELSLYSPFNWFLGSVVLQNGNLQLPRAQSRATCVKIFNIISKERHNMNSIVENSGHNIKPIYETVSITWIKQRHLEI